MAKRKRRYRKRQTEKLEAPNAPMTAVAKAAGDPLKTKVYACFVWPAYRIGLHIRFEDGFFATGDPDTQNKIEAADGYGLHIHDVTGAVMKKRQIGTTGKVYLCLSNPSLSLEHRITFTDGVFATGNPTLQFMIEQRPDFKIEIREITEKLLLAATAADEENAQAVA